ncbi:DUF2496 domain-containing protein [Pseudaeromonas sp. ZJS20]|uniref:DUF2496 domain-containing protein n=1 Tax=Pseudaeromonas aegiceratis TaxID=3153928 RepID=UPI00390C584C
MSLATAPIEIKLAVDIIQWLEENQIPAAQVLSALALVKRDYERKLLAEQTSDQTHGCPKPGDKPPSQTKGA